MEIKHVTDIEVQVQELGDSKETSRQTSTLVDDWDLPDNKENPRNWSACEC